MINKIPKSLPFFLLISVHQIYAQSSYFIPGYFIGGQMGLSFGSASFRDMFDSNDNRLGKSIITNTARNNSFQIGLLAGYRWIFEQGFTLQGDVSGNYFPHSEIKKEMDHFFGRTKFPFNNKLIRPWNMVFSLNMGKIFFDRWHASIGLGLGMTQFHQKIFSQFEPTIVAKKSFINAGFVPSVRIEYAVNKKISLVGNVSYELYQKTKVTFIKTITPIEGSSYSSTVSPRYINITFGANYRF